MGLALRAAEVRRCLQDLDVNGMRNLWKQHAPQMQQPTSDDEVIAMMHAIRTMTETLAPRLRIYSHSWLMERGMRSMLPQHMRPVIETPTPTAPSVNGEIILGKRAEYMVVDSGMEYLDGADKRRAVQHRDNLIRDIRQKG